MSYGTVKKNEALLEGQDPGREMDLATSNRQAIWTTLQDSRVLQGVIFG